MAYTGVEAVLNQSLADGTLKTAKLMFVKDGTANFTGDTELLGRISDAVNFNNPVLPYMNGVTIAEAGYTSVTIEYEIDGDRWNQKTKAGSTQDWTTIADVEFTSEVFKWNKPAFFEEKITAYDIKHGRAVDTLAARMGRASQRFMKASVKKAFAALVAKAIADTEASQLTLPDIASSTDLQKDAVKFGAQLKDAIRKFIEKNEFSADEITVTVSQEALDLLAEARLLGDQVKVQFDGGAYTIAQFGNYSIQAGSFMTLGKFGATGSETDFVALIGTNKAGFHQVETLAMNIRPLGASNDKQTYLEMAEIVGVMDYKGKAKFQKADGTYEDGKTHLHVITKK